ncbi:MAG: hypothetical protein M1838_001506 [Thelocarpon superellum]|nr:MAG: hypothetical protein M1838_001506 [Thelocarpon superellum]
MSRAPQQFRTGGSGNPYANGYHDSSPNRYDDDLNGNRQRSRSGGSGGGSRERRQGAYGGGSFDAADHGASVEPPIRSRPRGYVPQNESPRRRAEREEREWAEQQQQRGSRDRGRRNSSGRQATGQGARRIEDVLQYIRQDWDFMTDEKCVPVQVALQLMDPSSLGRAHQYDQFQTTHKQLQKALRTIVNEHYQGFNSSIGTFHQVQAAIQSSQERIQTLKDSLAAAKLNLSTAKPELKSLATSSQSYDDMLRILTQIERLQLLPEKLEARISEKMFLSAIEILHDGLHLIRRPEMDTIGALSDLRVYLANQENSLTEILIEELHSHLYLKSPYCQDRWKSFALAESNVVKGEENQEPFVVPAAKPLGSFLMNLDTSTPMSEDASQNPEADTFYYIRLLVESLHKLGHLDLAVDSIEQRLPVELFRVVEKTNHEIAQRHPDTIKGSGHRPKEQARLGLDESDARPRIISDLLWTLYAKFEAIAEGHRALHDVIAGIVKRESLGGDGSLTRGFNELWKLYQSEIRTLLHDYLATDGEDAFRSGQTQHGGGGGPFQRHQRDKNKKMFKLSDIDHQSVEMSTEQEDLEFILKSSVPGLISDSRTKAVVNQENSQSQDSSGTGHRLLVEPSVFNMGLLLPPSLSFIQRLKEVVPPGSDLVMNTLTSFLDDFLVNVFHPQLDETLVELSTQITSEVDAFQQDPHWTKLARKPILKGASGFFDLILAFCKMLDTIPHDQAFSQLIITQMVTYRDRCLEWFKALVSGVQANAESGSRLRRVAALASSGEIHDTIALLRRAGDADRPKILDKEIGLLIADTNQTPLVPSDLISNRRTITSLCLLYTSMEWLATKVGQLRHITSNPVDSSHADGRSRRGRRWTLLAPSRLRNERSSVYLPMTQDTVSIFDDVVQSYEELATTALLTLHVEGRGQVIHHINKSLQSNYVLEQAANDPDPYILTLNAGLVNFDEDITTHLRTREHSFITSGLGLLLDKMIVSNSSAIKRMNTSGCARMQLNILVLQQNLKNIEGDIVLARSARYFDFFADGPEAVIANAKETASEKAQAGSSDGTAPGGSGGGSGNFTYEELRLIIELYYSDALLSERREVAMQAKRELGDRLLSLSEYLWQS